LPKLGWNGSEVDEFGCQEPPVSAKGPECAAESMPGTEASSGALGMEMGP